MKKYQTISESEKEIINIIWKNGGDIFVSDLLEKLKINNKNWKRTTISTFASRLIEKGFLKTEKYGRTIKYITTISENEYLAFQTKNFVDEVFSGSVKGLLNSLFSQDCLKSDEIEDIKEFWNKNKGDIK